MSDAAEARGPRPAGAPCRAADPLVAMAGRAAVAVALPWLFYDWQQAGTPASCSRC